MPFRSIRQRRSRRRIDGVFELQLTSMMDVLVIILIFLLKSYATSTNSFTTVAGMQMPVSTSQDTPPDSLQVIVTPEGMTMDNERIVEFAQNAGSLDGEPSYELKKSDLDENDLRIIPLYDALTKAREKSEVLRAKARARDASTPEKPFEGILAIQADKRVKYDTIRKVMYTAAASGYRVFRFLARSESQ